MKRLILAYNPVSGHASFKNKLDYIIDSFQKRGVVIIPYRTTRDNVAFAEFAKDVEALGILAAGGDGTLHALVNACLTAKLNLPIGVLASGTSNDFAACLNLPVPLREGKAAEDYFDRIARGITQEIDIGKAGDRYFINVASAGMMTDIAHKTEPRLKNALGKFAYYWGGLKELPKFKSFDLKITADGKEWQVRAFLFVIVNSPVVGSLKNVSSKIKIDDGKLDLLAVTNCGATELMRLAGNLFAGKGIDNNMNVLHLTAKHFMVRTDVELIGDLDGEKGSTLPLVVETLPRALRMYY